MNALKIIGNLIDYVIHIKDNNLRTKTMYSLKHYASQKHKGFDYSKKYVKGDVCWIEFGDNLEPEMSLNHLGIIISKIGDKSYYALPITTPKSSNKFHMTAFHPVTNPTGNKYFHLLTKKECSCLNHDSVIKCMEPRMISAKRIISKVGYLDPASSLFLSVNTNAAKNIFPTMDYELNLLKKENSKLKMKLEVTKLPNCISSEKDLDLTLIDSQFRAEIKTVTNKIVVLLTDKYNQTFTKEIRMGK